jgi:hypothetical protein
MSDQGAQAVHETHGHVSSHASADAYQFEKSELDFFVEDDRETGKKIGKLLAVIFCILVVMMAGVAIWTNRNQFTSQDPYAAPADAAKAVGH